MCVNPGVLCRLLLSANSQNARHQCVGSALLSLTHMVRFFVCFCVCLCRVTSSRWRPNKSGCCLRADLLSVQDPVPAASTNDMQSAQDCGSVRSLAGKLLCIKNSAVEENTFVGCVEFETRVQILE